MRWGKLILLAQAFVTLILGIIFFTQILSVNLQEITQAEIAIDTSNTSPQQPTDLLEPEKQHSAASYILLFVSLIELIIITRLLT